MIFNLAHPSRLNAREEHVCPVHDMAESMRSQSSLLSSRTCQAYQKVDASSNFIGSTSFYESNMIVPSVCAAFACVIIFVHLIRFATHLSNPGEQIKYEAADPFIDHAEPSNTE